MDRSINAGSRSCDSAGTKIDIGAYERQTLAPMASSIVTTTSDELDYSNSAVTICGEAINR